MCLQLDERSKTGKSMNEDRLLIKLMQRQASSYEVVLKLQ